MAREDKLKKIAVHVAILNTEVGKIKESQKWMIRIIGYIAGVITIMLGKSLFY